MDSNDTNAKGTKMTKNEIKKHAREIVAQMLSGRCAPDSDDVRDFEGEEEKRLIISEIENTLDRLRKTIAR